MLTGMLLHMIEAAIPIDRAADFSHLSQGIFNPVRDPLALVRDLRNRDSPKPAEIEWLPARSRVKSRTIQINRATAIGNFRNRRSEIAKIGVRVIKAFCHETTIFPKMAWPRVRISVATCSLCYEACITLQTLVC